MLRRRKYYVIYPEYFDKGRSRNQGRRVPLSKAFENPSLPRIAKACQLLGLEYRKEPDKAFPSNWWNKQGRLLIRIDKKDKVPKEKLIKEIAEKARKLVPKKKKTVGKKKEVKTAVKTTRAKSISARKKKRAKK